MQTSPTETLLLSLMAHRPSGAFGSELVHMSDGKIKRGTVYPLLARLEKAGFVESNEVPASDSYAAPRTRYKITAEGLKARKQFAEWTGLTVPSFKLGGI